MRQLWVAELLISERTAAKLGVKHGLSSHDVRDALVCVRGLRYTWHESRERGQRVIVEIAVHRRTVLAVLYPTSEPDSWHLGSAYFA